MNVARVNEKIPEFRKITRQKFEQMYQLIGEQNVTGQSTAAGLPSVVAYYNCPVHQRKELRLIKRFPIANFEREEVKNS